MKKILPYTIISIALLVSCGPEGYKSYLVGETFTNERCTITFESSTFVETNVTIDISVTRLNDDIKALDHIVAHQGPLTSFDPDLLEYNGVSIELGSNHDEWGQFIVDYPISDDVFTLHVEYDVAIDSPSESFDILEVRFIFDCVDFPIIVYR